MFIPILKTISLPICSYACVHHLLLLVQCSVTSGRKKETSGGRGKMFLLSCRYRACSPELLNEVLHKCLFFQFIAKTFWWSWSDYPPRTIYRFYCLWIIWAGWIWRWANYSMWIIYLISLAFYVSWFICRQVMILTRVFITCSFPANSSASEL